MGPQRNTSRKPAAQKSVADDQLRRRVAIELRGSTLQAAAALAINLGVVKRLAGPWSDAAKVAIDECLQMTGQCQREIRTFAYLLHPPKHEQFGLYSALTGYLAALEKRSGCLITLVMEPGFCQGLSQSLELMVFRVIQECFASIEKDARLLQRIEVHCRRTPTRTSMEIKVKKLKRLHLERLRARQIS